MSKNCDVIAIFPIYSQFGASWKLDSGRIVCKTYIFINSNLFSYKNLNLFIFYFIFIYPWIQKKKKKWK